MAIVSEFDPLCSPRTHYALLLWQWLQKTKKTPNNRARKKKKITFAMCKKGTLTTFISN